MALKQSQFAEELTRRKAISDAETAAASSTISALRDGLRARQHEKEATEASTKILVTNLMARLWCPQANLALAYNAMFACNDTVKWRSDIVVQVNEVIGSGSGL